MSPLDVTVASDPEELGALAARAVAEGLYHGRAGTLGLATGSSPDALYRSLLDGLRAGRLPRARWAALRAFTLDEYIGLPLADPRRYRATIRTQFCEAAGITDERLYTPDVDGDLAESGIAYERAILAAGGIDVQVLGLGANGHVGFNEPGAPADSLTRVVQLTERTRQDNARFFANDVDAVPRRAVTQGIATIARAGTLVLLAVGAAKREALDWLRHGPIDAECPATLLRDHPRLIVIADRAAAT